MNAKAISEKQPGQGCSSCVLIPFGLIFMFAGLILFWFLSLSPLIQSYQAKSWPQTQCEITKSEIKVNRDSDGDSYKPIVEFKYTVDGIEYESDRPTFQNLSASKNWARGITDKHPVGSIQQCYYSPEDPKKSVLSKGFETSFYFFSLFPLIFVAIGAFSIGASFFAGRKKDTEKERAVSSQLVSGKKKKSNLFGPETEDAEEADFADKEWSLPRKLKPESSPFQSLIVATLFMFFWNGLVSVFVYNVFSEGEFWIGLFLIPFVLAGLFLIFGVLYLAMALFNPVIKIAMSCGAISPGEDVDIAWEVIGNARRFKKIKIHIFGEQEATYQRGTSTHTDEETFEVIMVVESEELENIEFGSTTVTIPLDTMHTFTAEHNKIRWQIAVHGTIPWWPDVQQVYPFRVKPI